MFFFQCTCNGLSYSQIENDGPATKTLEMFFSGYPNMAGLNHFVHLNTLVLIGQPIDKIENLHYCAELKELWICECRLKVFSLQTILCIHALLDMNNKNKFE